MNHEDEMHLEEKVMKKIKEERITFRSRYIFLAKKLGLSGGLALSLVLAVLFLNVVFSTLRASGNLEFLAFGRNGLLVFLESFPYKRIIIAVLFFLGASALLSRFDISYKRSFKIVILLLLVLVIGGATAMTIGGVSERFEERFGQGPLSILRALHRPRDGVWRHGLVGEVMEVEDRALTVKTFRGEEVTVVFSEKTRFLGGSDFQVGDFVRTVGRWKEGTFRAFGIHRSRHGRGKFFLGRKFKKHVSRQPSGQ